MLKDQAIYTISFKVIFLQLSEDMCYSCEFCSQVAKDKCVSYVANLLSTLIDFEFCIYL